MRYLVRGDYKGSFNTDKQFVQCRSEELCAKEFKGGKFELGDFKSVQELQYNFWVHSPNTNKTMMFYLLEF